MVIFPFQSFVDNSCGGIVEKQTRAVRTEPMHRVESAAVSANSWFHSLMNFGSRNKKKLQLLFAKTLPLKLCDSDMKCNCINQLLPCMFLFCNTLHIVPVM